MFASSSVDVVTAIAVGGRGWVGGGTGVPVVSDVDLVIAVGGRACADVHLDVTAVGGRTGGGAGGGVDVNISTVGGAGVAVGSGVDIAATAVGGSAGGLLVCPTAGASASTSPQSEGELVVASTSPKSEGELVVVLVVVSTSPQSGRERDRQTETETGKEPITYSTNCKSTTQRFPCFLSYTYSVSLCIQIYAVTATGYVKHKLHHQTNLRSRRSFAQIKNCGTVNKLNCQSVAV